MWTVSSEWRARSSSRSARASSRRPSATALSHRQRRAGHAPGAAWTSNHCAPTPSASWWHRSFRHFFATRHGLQRDRADSSGIWPGSKYARELQSVDDERVSLACLSDVRPEFGRLSGGRTEWIANRLESRGSRWASRLLSLRACQPQTDQPQWRHNRQPL
jgi:hypothetical protein